MQVACTRAGGYETRNSAAADGARDGHDVVVSSCGPIHLPPCTMTFVDSRRVRSAGCDTQIGAYTHRTPRLRICAKMRRWGACRSLTRALGAWSIAGDNNAWDLATQSCVVTYIAHWRRCATALSDTVQAAWACWACGQLVIRAGRRMADGEGRLAWMCASAPAFERSASAAHSSLHADLGLRARGGWRAGVHAPRFG